MPNLIKTRGVLVFPHSRNAFGENVEVTKRFLQI